MAAGFYLACKRWPALARKPVLSGSLYGIALYVAMTYVVVPLSNAGNGGLPAWRWENLSHIAGHMLLVGIPCALGARFALASRHCSRAGRECFASSNPAAAGRSAGRR